MRTVKQVAALTGVSVRTLQYYDEIGLLRPTRVTEAGYRYYDEQALAALQQVLFFRELDFPLKQIKAIMQAPDFDKIEAFKKQSALLTAKRDRLNRLLALLGRLAKGETCMEFESFDLSEYVQALEQFKRDNEEAVRKHFGSIEAFDDLIQRARDHEESIAQSAVQYYGSVEEYVQAMKRSLTHFSENMEKMQRIQEKGYVAQNQRLMEQLTADVTKDPRCPEIQDIVAQMDHLLEAEDTPVLEMGAHFRKRQIEGYLYDQAIVKQVDARYGPGAARFIGLAMQRYFENQGVLEDRS